MHPEATVTLACALPGAQAPVAQRIEHLTTDQKVWGSNPYGRAKPIFTVHLLLMRLPPYLLGSFNSRRDARLASP
jgi:hypothetical protein